MLGLSNNKLINIHDTIGMIIYVILTPLVLTEFKFNCYSSGIFRDIFL